MTRAILLCLAVFAVAAMLGWLVAGAAGLVVVAVAEYAFALVAVRLSVPWAGDPRRPRDRRVPLENPGFPVYRRMETTLPWAQTSGRHYDLAVRPVLQRLLAARLAQRHGVDLARQPERARALVGPELWPLVDPARPASDDSHSPGVPLAVVGLLVQRMEDL
jgi:hypothetical protein